MCGAHSSFVSGDYYRNILTSALHSYRGQTRGERMGKEGKDEEPGETQTMEVTDVQFIFQETLQFKTERRSSTFLGIFLYFLY